MRSSRSKQSRQSGCLSSLTNVLAALLLIASLVAVGAFAVIFLVPGAVDNPFAAIFEADRAAAEIVPPTLAVAAALPTQTPTPTEEPLQPTWTPLAAPPTATALPPNASLPTNTPSPVPTFPTRTPTPTHTPTPSNTPTPTPTGPTPTPSSTRSAFPFTKTDNSPFYLQNFANAAGCDWLGVAGEVLDLNRNPVSPGSYVVHVWGSGVDERLLVGSAPAYSPSGWEQFLFDSPVIRDYNVQLETPNGTAVSQIYRVQTRSSCNENLLRLDFLQNH